MDLLERKRIEDLKKAKRAEKNRDLIERMKAGENLALYDPADTFFPPRPLVEKNKDAIRRLYSNGGESETEFKGAGEASQDRGHSEKELSRD